MRIGDLDMHCGKCELIDYCGEPYEYAICNADELREMEQSEYLRMVRIMQGEYKDYKQLFEMICEERGG